MPMMVNEKYLQGNVFVTSLNETGCPGTQSDQAGKSNSCSGCPNQRICASGEAKKLDPGSLTFFLN